MRSRSSQVPRVKGWTPRQWRALRSPHRLHLVAALEALGEASVAELAVLTGRTRPSIYPHMVDMARAGIIERGSRQGRGRRVATFRFVPARMACSVNQATGRGLRAGAEVSAGALREAASRCRRWGAVADGTPIDFSRNPEAYTSVRITWMDERRRRRVNRLLQRLQSVLQEGCVRRTGRRTCVLLYHFPDFTAIEARAALVRRRATKA
jgi:DNA-binding transcriptional ArsR family regulator